MIVHENFSIGNFVKHFVNKETFKKTLEDVLNEYKSILFPDNDINLTIPNLRFELIKGNGLESLFKTKEKMIYLYTSTRLINTYSLLGLPLFIRYYLSSENNFEQPTKLEQKICKRFVVDFEKISLSFFRKWIKNLDFINFLLISERRFSSTKHILYNYNEDFIEKRLSSVSQPKNEALLQELINKAKNNIKHEEFILTYTNRDYTKVTEEQIKKCPLFKEMKEDDLEDLICEAFCEKGLQSELLIAMILFPIPFVTSPEPESLAPSNDVISNNSPITPNNSPQSNLPNNKNSKNNPTTFATPTEPKKSNLSNKADNNNSNKTAYIVGGVIAGVLLLGAAYYIYQSKN